MKLTAKQKKFALEYVKTGNATKSALKAGYSKKTARSIGQQNLTKVDIKNFIDEKMKELENAKIANAVEVLQLLTRVIRGEEKETVVVATANSIKTLQKEADIKTKLVAAKELLKRFPVTSDELQNAILEKAKAEADIARFKADMMLGADGEDKVVIVDDID